MARRARKLLKAIDLYAGIGGWSLGLNTAGIEVQAAYEIWPDAVATYNANLIKHHLTADVRTLCLAQLPAPVDLVVGSPPCTEFSLANRGGGGNISEGLKDIIRFLEIVEFLRPKFWVLENVPRIAELIIDGLSKKNDALFRFRHLKPTVHVFNFASFGLAQSRRRCLIGNFPFDLFSSYAKVAKPRTLRDVITSLADTSSVRDPIWGGSIPRTQLSEMEPEPPLDGEELRLNREAKQYHPVYNDMSFPDELDVPARTVTATCTRISRESIVIRDPNTGLLRRLTVRERASLQAFPVSFQFLSNSHSSKVRMIGNAVPPLISYLAGMAALQKSPTEVESGHLRRSIVQRLVTVPLSSPTPPQHATKVLSARRRFHAALPGLRFKSGMRFELCNEIVGSRIRWRIRFFYGPSKGIRSVPLNGNVLRGILSTGSLRAALPAVQAVLCRLSGTFQAVTPSMIQEVWIGRGSGLGPFDISDLLGTASAELIDHLKSTNREAIQHIVLKRCGPIQAGNARLKICRNALPILAGFIIGGMFNRTALGCFASCEHRNPSERANTVLVPRCPPEDSLRDIAPCYEGKSLGQVSLQAFSDMICSGSELDAQL